MDVTEVVRAAGGVVWRRDPGGSAEVLLVHRPAYDDWTFPKGKLEPGESEPEAALREVEEETGLRCLLGRELALTSYADARGRPKTVRYWAMATPVRDAAPAHEVDEARWTALEEAEAMLSYERDHRVLGVLAGVTEPVPGTVPVYVVRHAKAGNRARWDGLDHVRPLTAAGRRQAGALADSLADRDLAAAISSPYARCMETLEPLAAARGLFLQPCDALAEGAGSDEVLDLALMAAANGPTVLSTHGDIQQALVEELAGAGVQLEGQVAFEKGSTWVLEVQEGAVMAARHISPPA